MNFPSSIEKPKIESRLARTRQMLAIQIEISELAGKIAKHIEEHPRDAAGSGGELDKMKARLESLRVQIGFPEKEELLEKQIELRQEEIKKYRDAHPDSSEDSWGELDEMYLDLRLARETLSEHKYQAEKTRLEIAIADTEEEIAELSKPKEEKPKTTTRRRFLATTILAGGAAALGIHKSKRDAKVETPETKKPEPAPLPEARETRELTRERKIRNNISECLELIRSEKYEDFLKNPYLVSALYYSKDALEEMSPPHEGAAEEIIWNIRAALSQKIREGYFQMLNKKISIGAGINHIIANSEIQSSPIDSLQISKNLDDNHQDALDIFMREGSPVRSITSGIVVLAENGWRPDDDMSTSSNRGGNVIIIFNPNDNNFYRYAHFQDISVEVGSALQGGKIIGTIGHTGINASRPGHGEHVHLEINRYDSASGTMVATSAQALRRSLEKFLKR